MARERGQGGTMTMIDPAVAAEGATIIAETGEVVGEGIRAGGDPVRQAFQALHLGFSAAPVIAGLDKFGNRLVNWDQYLAPQIGSRMPDGGRTFMRGVGVVEVAAGLLTAARPGIGGFVVSGWLMGIVGNLLLSRRYYDIALRDFGLSVGAFALGRLGQWFARR